MSDFNVTGKYPARHFVELCFTKEFQFKLKFTKDRVVLVAFYKGVWEVYFCENDAYVRLTDAMDIEECTNKLYLGFLEGRIHEKRKFPCDTRFIPSKILCDLLQMKYGNFSNFLEGVDILQSGRNGYIDRTLLPAKISLSPEPKSYRIPQINDENIWTTR